LNSRLIPDATLPERGATPRGPRQGPRPAMPQAGPRRQACAEANVP
jgi:hypothetical protein